MSEGYSDIKILEANRRQSFYQDDSPASWSNKLSNGVKLNIGDEIQLHSAYVSELGAQDATIEILGQNFNSSGTFNYEAIEDAGTKNDYPDTGLKVDGGLVYYYDYNYQEVVSKTLEYELNDNELNLLVSPYKNANGEFHAMLPRNWIGPSDGKPEDEWAHTWDVFDFYNAPGAPGGGGGINFGARAKESYNINDTRPVQEAYASANPDARYKVMNRIDNSRYTIFGSSTIRNVKGYNESGMSLPPVVDGIRDIPTHKYYTQIKYPVKCSVNKGFNSPANIASQLTEQLNQRNNYDIKNLPVDFGVPDVPNSVAGGTNTNLYATTETQTYKTYFCANPDHMNKDVFEDEWGKNGLGDKSIQYYNAFQYIGVKRPDLFRLGRVLNASQGFLAYPEGTGGGTTRADSRDAEIITDLLWNEFNLNNLRNLFNAETNYPELFDYLYWSNEGPEDSEQNASMNYQTPQNSRFLHMNMYNNASSTNGGPAQVPTDFFGYDLNLASVGATGNTTATLGEKNPTNTMPFFIGYDPNSIYVNELNETPDPDGSADHPGGAGHNKNVLGYGFALKRRRAGRWYIAFEVSRCLPEGSLIPRRFFSGGFDMDPWTDDTIYLGRGSPRRMGWDYHFTAYGCPCMLLTNGLSGKFGVSYGKDSTQELITYHQKNPPNLQPPPKHEIAPWLYHLYLGAESPLVNFDTAQSRFTISSLHTAEKIGNLWNAGKIIKEESANNAEQIIDENPSASQTCYKINKQLNRTNYTPDCGNYKTDHEIEDLTGTPASFKTTINALSESIDADTIFDSMSGIFIEDWGMPEAKWSESLLGLMGFSYSQFHPTNPVNSQTRVNNDRTLNFIKPQTTNQIVVMEDSGEWTRNVLDKPLFNPVPACVLKPLSTNAGQNDAWVWNVRPEIVVAGDSVAITAENLPTKSLRPYFTIRSDIMQQKNYVGSSDSGMPLPVVGIVDKMNGQGDFFFQQSEEMIFTNTEDRVITDIKTSVHNPDGSLANLDGNSCVLYRINKMIQADLTPVQTLLQSKKKKDQKLAEEILE